VLLVALLSLQLSGVRLGAANTLRGLSRSVRVLRGPTLTPDLAAPLVTLLQDSSSCEVQVRGSRWAVVLMAQMGFDGAGAAH
jgi:hypothetical protein